MSQRLTNLGLPLAFCAALILTLPACSSSEFKRWDPEVIVDEEPVDEAKFIETVTAGKLTLTATRTFRTRETPIERLTLVHEETYSDMDWDNFGLTFFAILGGIVSVGLYFIFAFVVFDETKENEN